jgi:hypothetical protein
MDISYAVLQLDRDIAIARQQLTEKERTRKSLYGALAPDEKKSVDEANSKLLAAFSGKPAPPPPIGA